MKYWKFLYRLLVYFNSFTVCSGDIEKEKKSSENEKKKKSSENDQSTGHFQSFFLFPLRPQIWKKIPVNQLIKKIWPYAQAYWSFKICNS